MQRYVAIRLAMVVPVVLLAVTVAFFTLHLIPGDPAELVAGPHASAEAVAHIRESLNLDKPLYVQYVLYFHGLLRGDMGKSNMSGQPVAQEIADRLPTTIRLTFGALLFAVVFGPALGLLAALRQNTIPDYLASATAVAGMSVPAFWLGLMLIFVFAERLRWFPSMGIGSPSSWILPSLTLGVATVGSVARMMRATMLEVLGEDYLATARAKGLSERVILVRHALRNALIPVVTVIGNQIGYLLGGALMVETVFSLPGLGRMMVQAVLSKDYPVVQGGIVVIALMVIVVNLAVDLLYVVLDPRLRSQG
jgi:glutathione transport system permease protein